MIYDEIEEYIPGESAICYKDVKEEWQNVKILNHQ